MKTVQLRKFKNQDWNYIGERESLKNPLVLVLGNRYLLEDDNIYSEVKELFPDGNIVFGSTCGDISLKEVTEDSITITAVELERSTYKVERCSVSSCGKGSSFDAGVNLMKKLPQEGLKYVLILSEGSFVNGSELVSGVNSHKGNDVVVTGGLCGDDARFEKTLASYNENPKQGEIIGIGFYGETLEVSSAVDGGWTPFGPERIVTKSDKNILYELDGKPALDLYKQYLGDKANDLPASALLYPLNVKAVNENKSFVRTILNINEEENAMILAGNIPENSEVQLMMTSIDNIADASDRAAKHALNSRNKKPELAILVSCVGRKLVMDQRVEEEVEEISEIIGSKSTVCGFYSYGEISPFSEEVNCQLHNQTMAITLLSE